MTSISLAGRTIGPTSRCFVIAEAGVNHDGRLDRALALVAAAAAAGADAVKFQTFSADTLVSPRAPQFPYVRAADDGSRSQYEMLRRLELPRDWHEPIRRRCEALGLLFLSTPFHESDADWLEAFGVPAFKIASGDVTNLPLLAHVGRKGRPILLSTGMSTLAEVARAVETVTESGNDQLVLLHCVSDYPADPRDANLRAMDTMRRAFDVPVGFSDHSRGLDVSLAAAALGASVLERHVTTDRALPGPDHAASLEPGELADLVRGIRVVESALGSGIKRPARSEEKTRLCVRKSVVAVRDLARGERLDDGTLALRRPGGGLPPDALPLVLGRRLQRDVEAGALITPDDLA